MFLDIYYAEIIYLLSTAKATIKNCWSEKFSKDNTVPGLQKKALIPRMWSEAGVACNSIIYNIHYTITTTS